MKFSHKLAAISLAVLFSAPAAAEAPVSDATLGNVSNAELLKRLDDLSRVITVRNKMQVRFQSQLDDLAQELTEIKGSMELFENQLSQIENRQRTLFQMLEEQRQQIASANKVGTPIVTTPADSSEQGQPGEEAVTGNAQQEYQSAYLLIGDKQFPQAIEAFKAFVQKYPDSTYAPNANYWLGQLLYREKSYDQARVAFLVVIDKYPESNKRADSLLKVGFIDERMNNKDSAKSFYQKTISEYPQSSAAKLAESSLQNL